MPEAKRIRVKIEYEAVRRVATMIQRREPTLPRLVGTVPLYYIPL